MELEVPTQLLMALPMLQMVEVVSSARPPRLSATRGTKSMFRERQAERLEVSLLLDTNSKCMPEDAEVSDRELLCRGLMTCTSRAAGRPLCHAGRYMSAGLEEELGMNPGVSLAGVRPAVWAVAKMTSRMALCLKILSPLPPQPIWWSPDGSACPLHTGQEKEVLKSGTTAGKLPIIEIETQMITFNQSPEMRCAPFRK